MKRLVITLAALLGVSCMLSAQVEVGEGAKNFTVFGLDEVMVFHGDDTVYNALVVTVITEGVK